MASIINASTTSTTGLVQSADASGVLQLQTNGITGLTLHTTANVTLANNLIVTANVAANNITTTGRIVEGTQECAQFGYKSTFTLPNANIVIVPFDTAIIYQGITFNATASTVGGIEGYHWQHSTTGIFRLFYQVRSTGDVWNMISVCKNNNTALPVGNGYRSGSPSGLWGIAYECLYKVSNTTDRFGLFHWAVGNLGAGGMLAHSGGNPDSSFFVTPDSGTAPATGYYNTITITRV
jgi:hypothetical protein